VVPVEHDVDAGLFGAGDRTAQAGVVGVLGLQLHAHPKRALAV
jgi:hypothetical protein